MYAATDAWVCIKIYDKLMETEPIEQVPLIEVPSTQQKPQAKPTKTEKARNEVPKSEEKAAKPKRRFRPKRKDNQSISNKL